MNDEPDTRLDSNGVPFPPDPDPSSSNLAGITIEELTAQRIAKYREVLQADAAAPAVAAMPPALQEIIAELRALREAVERLTP